jgi:hypothetical protein
MTLICRIFIWASFWQLLVDADELETLKEIGAAWLEAKKERLDYAIKEGILKDL